MKTPTRYITKPEQITTLLGIGTGVSLLGDSTLYTVLPNADIRAHMGITLTMVGLLLGANRAIRLLINGPVGILYERMPRRPLLILSIVLGAVSNIIFGIGFGFWPLLVGRVVWGIAWSLLFIGSTAVILEVGSDENRGRLSGRYQMLFLLGVGLSSLLGGILTDQFGFRTGQLICSGIVLAMALIWFVYLPETETVKKDIQKKKNNTLANEILPLRVIIPTSAILLLTRFITWGVLASTSAIWISKLFGEGVDLADVFLPIATITGIYSTLKMIPGISSAPIAGILSDKTRKRWIVVATSILVGAFGTWVMSDTTTMLALAGAFLPPIISGSVESLIPAIIGDQADRKIHGRILGIVHTFGDLGAMLGPMAALWVIDSSIMPLKDLYRSCTAILMFAFFISLLQTKTEKRFREMKT